AVSHEVDECVEHEKSVLDTLKANEAKGIVNQGGLVDWGAHQVRASHNYSADSLLSLHFSGGLNLQIEHHLFPSVSHVHYPAISKIVRETCAEFNLPYTTHSWFHAIRSFGKMLVALSLRSSYRPSDAPPPKQRKQD
ncbi:hypothetical protein GR268_47070, partial [Rhizobium leguminosarum]|nr:hypothetical protein [Rhizobium leguminosarum]